MKTTTITNKGNMMSVECYEAESIETKVRRILDENEPITDGAPIIYTPMEDGVKPEYNIRTDRWQIAIDAMDKVSAYEASKYLKKQEAPAKDAIPEGKQGNVQIKTEGSPKAPKDN